MYFNLKKYNTSGLTFVDDSQIPKNKIRNNRIVNINSIIFDKSFKIRIRASKMIDGKTTVRKKIIKFPKEVPLSDAIKECSKIYNQMMDNISEQYDTGSCLIPTMKFKDVFNLYIDEKVKEHQNNSSRKPYDKHGAIQFFEKWLKPIHNKKMNEIFRRHITTIKVNMVNKKGQPLADRTKLTVHQFVNPVYKFFNLNSNHYLKSPATILKSDKFSSNNRKFDLTISEINTLFNQLYNYPQSPFREIFVWLMHGRRRNEVLELKWENIDFNKKTYTIPAINNKARIDMTYKLSNRLLQTLETIGLKSKGYVFTQLKDQSKHFSSATLRNHWNKMKQPIVLHQIRNCIVHYLKNEHGISNEICGFIIGHTQTSSITEIYGTYGYDKLDETLNLMLDEVFDETKIDPKLEKLRKLKTVFPEKTDNELKLIFEAIDKL